MSLREIAKRLLRSPVGTVIESRIGPVAALRAHRRLLADLPDIPDGLKVAQARWGVASADADEPIFILAAGWRSGSTLLQRLVTSGGALIWGEPWAHCDLVRRLADSMRAVEADYPPDHFFLGQREAGADVRAGVDPEWIANLYPGAERLLAAHQAFFHELFRVPALDRGFARWGVKAVRLGIPHAEYLRWLFPRARFVVIYRNPYDAYRSYRVHRGWYDRWPDRPILTPAAFGVHWRSLVESYLTAEAPPGPIVSLEDLIGSTTTLDRLSRHLGLPLDRSVLERRVGSTRGETIVPATEYRALRKAVEPVASDLGYEGPT